jgi:chaperonin GroEL
MQSRSEFRVGTNRRRLAYGCSTETGSDAGKVIAINAGEDGSVVVGKIQDNDTAFGFDAQFENLVSHGIIDPTKVVRTALQDAASIAGLLITTEAMVAEVPKKQPPAPPMPGGGMDY